MSALVLPEECKANVWTFTRTTAQRTLADQVLQDENNQDDHGSVLDLVCGILLMSKRHDER